MIYVYRKRWRLVHLPIILSVRKPQHSSQKRTDKLEKNFKPSIHKVVSTGTSYTNKFIWLYIVNFRLADTSIIRTATKSPAKKMHNRRLTDINSAITDFLLLLVLILYLLLLFNLLKHCRICKR